MCIAFFNLALPGYRLALASNRDEYLARQTSVAEWREGVLSGIDEAGGVGGTWLGVSKEGKVGVLLNIRDDVHPPNPPTRGLLVKRFLQNNDVDPSELQGYEGCNLLTFKVGMGKHMGEVMSNRGQSRIEVLKSDWAGVSNSPLEEPWPKVLEGVEVLRGADGSDESSLVDAMFSVLRRSVPLKSFEDRMHATLVPAVNLGTESSPRWYGTRLSTVVLIRNDGTATFIERDILELDDTQGWREGTGERRYDFNVQ